ncbi:MAG: hypothetical protein JNN30_00595 [Rhodanobacteraceae bacterium]|nr:hypothetical protein [Rhodanobacteraceae bacterium]
MFERVYVVGLLLAIAGAVSANSSIPSAPPTLRKTPPVFSVQDTLPSPPHEVGDLRFRDVFELPVGPRGLEATQRLRELDGRRVRLVGYMVQADVAGGFILSPLPAALGHADEGLADDLPPSALLVALPRATELRSGHMPGLIQVTGLLRVGNAENTSVPGRVFPARIELDSRLEKALVKANK